MHHGTDLIAERSLVDERSEKKFACMSQRAFLSNEIYSCGIDLIAERSPDAEGDSLVLALFFRIFYSPH
jgi:hypothetical protein